MHGHKPAVAVVQAVVTRAGSSGTARATTALRPVGRMPASRPWGHCYAALRLRLADMASGDALPSVRKLAEEYGVSTATVVKAMGRLRASGDIVSRKGWGGLKA